MNMLDPYRYFSSTELASIARLGAVNFRGLSLAGPRGDQKTEIRLEVMRLISQNPKMFGQQIAD